MDTTTIWGIVVLGILISFIGGLTYAILSAAKNAAKEKVKILEEAKKEQ